MWTEFFYQLVHANEQLKNNDAENHRSFREMEDYYRHYVNNDVLYDEILHELYEMRIDELEKIRGDSCKHIETLENGMERMISSLSFDSLYFFQSATEIEHPQYDVLIYSATSNDPISEHIKRILPQWMVTFTRIYSEEINIKTCLDYTKTAVIVVLSETYELHRIFQDEITHIFKRQIPLVVVKNDKNFHPNSSWLNLICNAASTQLISYNSADFKEKLSEAIASTQWDLPSNKMTIDITTSTENTRRQRFLGHVQEWNVSFRDPALVSHNYRKFISDPIRFESNVKLRDFFYHYGRVYFKKADIHNLLNKAMKENDVRYFVQAYTSSTEFNKILNQHLAMNVLYYFGPNLDENIDYRLVKSLIDFVTLLAYRRELSPYLFAGTVYRGVAMSKSDLHKYVAGARIMNTAFLSTSTDKQVAEIFSGIAQAQFAVICEYIIKNKAHTRIALDISNLSSIPDEREILILPLSPFRIQSVTHSVDGINLSKMVLIEDDPDNFDFSN